MPPVKETAAPPVVYRLNTDDAFYLLAGRRPLVTVKDIVARIHRHPKAVQRRLNQFEAVGDFARITCPQERIVITSASTHKCPKCEHEFQEKHTALSGKRKSMPDLWYLTVQGASRFAGAKLIGWDVKGNPVHDRCLTEAALAFDSALGDLIEYIHLRRDKQLMLTAGGQSHYADGLMKLVSPWRFYIEFTNAKPSSMDGKNDIDEKMEFYNRLLKDDPYSKVIFIFHEQADPVRQNDVKWFLARYADTFPYDRATWCWTTDLQSIKEDARRHIFWSPADFDERTWAFSDLRA